MIARWRPAAALFLMLAAAAVSALLLLHHFGEQGAAGAVAQACGAGADSGCDTVARSRWSSVGGVPIAAIGLGVAASLVLLLGMTLFASAQAQVAVGAGVFLVLAAVVVVDLALLGVQAAVIRAFCKLCILTYVLNALALLALWPVRKLAIAIPPALRERDGRIVAVGWVLGTLMLVLGIASAVVALRAREQARVGGILGSAAAPSAVGTTPSAVAPGDLAGQLQLAQAQARELQATIDDPQKLERYFADKAMREFEQAPVQSFDLTQVKPRGPADARVHVVEFSDFLCPFCQNLARAFEGFLPQSGGRVAIHFKNYPLDQACNPKLQRNVHPGACNLALGSVCAGQQGKSWEYHDKVFAAPPPNASPDDVAKLAAEAGLDGTALRACLDSPAAKERLAKEIAEAEAAGVASTPTVYINGRKLPRLNDFLQVIDKEAARLGLPPLPKPVPHAAH